MEKIIEALNLIENVNTTITESEIKITNSNSFTALVNPKDISNFENITSPTNEICLKLNLSDDNFLIITPKDFVFNTLNGKVIKVSNLPEMISINEMLDIQSKYIKNPEPNNNMDNTIALYLLTKLVILSAKAKNFDVDYLLKQIKKAANKTSVKEDIEELENYII
jgi:hypothetical protein